MKNTVSYIKKTSFFFPVNVMAGFVMVETLVAVSVILLAVPAVLSMTTKGITIGAYAKNQMIASYLAEEGVEFVRNRRDYNLLKHESGDLGVQWDDGFDGGSDKCRPTGPNGGCTVDPLATMDNIINRCNGCKIDTVPPSAGFRLYTDVNGVYSHNAAGTATPFWRAVFVEQVSGQPDQYTITSKVVWSTVYGQKNVSVSGFITNWLK